MINAVENTRTIDGIVASTKMDKTIVVVVETQRKHPLYGKIVRKRTKYYAHNELPVNVGDVVRLVHTRPLSKLKRWKTVEVVNKRSEQ